MADFDPKEFEPLGIILRIPVRRKKQPKGGGGGGKQGGGGGGSTVARMVRRAPEVMVKITGRTRGLEHLQTHLDYITRNGEVTAIGPGDSVVMGRDAVREVARTWWGQRSVVPPGAVAEASSAVGARRRNSVESVNFMLSMPKDTDRDKFGAAAMAFADQAFGGKFEYLIADHRDTDHTHVHLTVRARGENGERLNPRKEDLAMWREWMAHELRARGIEAEATPRRARGVVQKAKNQAIKHLDMRGASRVQKAKVIDAVRQVNAGVDRQELPWEAATRAKQSEIRKAWGDLANQFEQQGGDGRRFADEIRRFVADMPPVKTEREAIREVVSEKVRERNQERDDHER